MKPLFERISRFLGQGVTCIVNSGEFDTVQLLKLAEIAKANNTMLHLHVSDTTPLNVIDLIADKGKENIIINFCD